MRRSYRITSDPLFEGRRTQFTVGTREAIGLMEGSVMNIIRTYEVKRAGAMVMTLTFSTEPTGIIQIRTNPRISKHMLARKTLRSTE